MIELKLKNGFTFTQNVDDIPANVVEGLLTRQLRHVFSNEAVAAVGEKPESPKELAAWEESLLLWQADKAEALMSGEFRMVSERGDAVGSELRKMAMAAAKKFFAKAGRKWGEFSDSADARKELSAWITAYIARNEAKLRPVAEQIVAARQAAIEAE